MIGKNHVHEELLIDYALGNASTEQQKVVKQHTNHCIQCEKRLEEWSHVLSKPTSVRPSLALKEKVIKNVEKQSPSSKNKRKRTYMVAISSVATLFLILVGLLVDNHLNVNSYEVARNDEINVQNFHKNHQTQQVAVIPVTDFNDITGNLWINDVSQEMLLEVDGLTHISNRDYQLWIIYDNDEIKGELLSTVNGATRVMIKGRDVNQFKTIKASIEPIGGSKKPTGPETFIIPIKN